MIRPKVLIYKNKMLPYSQTFVRAQAEALINFQPHYLGLRKIQGLALPEDRSYFLSNGSLWGKVNEWVSLKRGLKGQGFKHLNHLKPALIHAHFGRDGAAVLPLAKTLKIPLIVTFHGFDATTQIHQGEDSLHQKIFAQRFQALQQGTNRFIAVSHFIKEKLLARGYSEDKVTVHYIGIDTSVFKPDLAFNKREPIVLFVGRLVEKKGCEYLIRAVSSIQAQRPDVKCIIIGDGVLRPKLEGQAKERLRNYQFLGKQPPDIVKAWMQKARVFCVPSITAQSGDAEGFGLVFTEAQSMGLPVVSFASGGIPEAVAHEKTGFLAPEKDGDRLAQYLYELLTNPELWNTLSHQGMEYVEKHFNLRKQTVLLENLYQTTISSSMILDNVLHATSSGERT